MSGTYPEIGLTLLAATAGLMLWQLARREPAWRWASLGMLAWALHSVFRLLEPYYGLESLLKPSQTLLLVGVAAWVATLRQLRPTGQPRWTLALAPILVVVVTITLPASLPDSVWLAALLPLVLALPLVEAALRGQASEPRLVWGLGLLLKAAGSFGLVWLGFPPAEFVYFSWAVGYILIAWGGYLEIRDARMDKVLLGFVLTSLLTSLVLLAVGLDQASHHFLPATLGWWGYAVLLVLGGFGLVTYRRIARAERQLELWVSLLESLTTKTQTTQHLTPQAVLQDMLNGLKPLFGNLVGLEVRSDVTIRAGQGGPYVYTFELVLEHPAEGRLYFSSTPKYERGLKVLAPLLTERLRLSLALNEWRSKAYTDPLTGLLNRRGLERRMQRLIRLAALRGKPVSVALLDIDRFKRVNDIYGHAVGDKVLKELAELLRKASRSDDLAVRMGGEEFGLVFFGADLEAAYGVLERIRSEVWALQIAPIAWRVSVSGGLAGGAVPSSVKEVERWFEQADQALYEAKQAGRDRVYPIPNSTPLLQDLLEN